MKLSADQVMEYQRARLHGALAYAHDCVIDEIVAAEDKRLLFGAALAKEREAFRAVIRWRALYSRCRERMERMDWAAREGLHNRLKDAEQAAIFAHKAAERDVLLLWSGFSRARLWRQ